MVIPAERGDAVACRQLVEAFLPAIVALARGFRGSQIEDREPLQEGVGGLLLAARRYDPACRRPSGRTSRSGCVSRCRN
jgi:DNA-directed RNA polymerase sigma subunit (sigma70/sigma32)